VKDMRDGEIEEIENEGLKFGESGRSAWSDEIVRSVLTAARTC
jgi:hypothetical protein